MEQAHTQLGDSFRVSALGAAGPSLGLGFALRTGLGRGQGPCPGALWASGSALPPLPSLKATSRLTGLLESWGLRVGRPQGRGQWRPGLPHPPSSLSETRREGGGLFTPPSLCVPTCLTGPTARSSRPALSPGSPVLLGPRGAVVGAGHLHQGRCETLRGERWYHC